MAGKLRNPFRKTSDIFLDSFIYIFLAVVVIITIYPFWNIFVISINDPLDAVRGNLYFWPRVFSFKGYQTVLGDKNFVNSISITILRTVIGTPLAVLATSMFAYSMSRRELIGRKFLNVAFIFTMYFGGGIVPYYMILKSIGLIDNFWVYIFPNIISVYNMILIRSYIDNMPAEIFESAKIDGANDIVIFFRMILPLTKPILMTVTLFVAIMQWNSWFDSHVYTSSQGLKTLQAMIYQLLTKYDTKMMTSAAARMSDAANKNVVTPDSIRMASTMISTIPIMLMYPFVQKHFVKGIMVGAIKD
ncbi:MAG: carbohydrate ABC transporter permease [Oscillospiraceae bacterium]